MIQVTPHMKILLCSRTGWLQERLLTALQCCAELCCNLILFPAVFLFFKIKAEPALKF